MRRLGVFSGKGGTGKSSLVASFASLGLPAPAAPGASADIVAVDCDVDAANLGILLKGDGPTADGDGNDFRSGYAAIVDRDRCTGCGLCLDTCRFDALALSRADGKLIVDELNCEGCGACVLACHPSALRLEEQVVGAWRVRRTPTGLLVHAQLGVGNDNSGKLVAFLREEADRQAAAAGIDTVLVDGPPGVGCAVHAALGRLDHILAVTEPTLSGEHDLERLLQLATRFHVKAAVAVNKWDLHPESTERIEALAARLDIPVLGRVPFDPGVPEALAQGRLPLESPARPETGAAIRSLWERLLSLP